jgi:hypothetical protein
MIPAVEVKRLCLAGDLADCLVLLGALLPGRERL